MSEFNKQDDLRFDQYVARKLWAWFTRFPPTQRVATAADNDDTEGGPDGQAVAVEGGEVREEAEDEEAYALSGGE